MDESVATAVDICSERTAEQQRKRKGQVRGVREGGALQQPGVVAGGVGGAVARALLGAAAMAQSASERDVSLTRLSPRMI
eukprot:429510-Pleurochrysis_carterae.AAC.1